MEKLNAVTTQLVKQSYVQGTALRPNATASRKRAAPRDVIEGEGRDPKRPKRGRGAGLTAPTFAGASRSLAGHMAPPPMQTEALTPSVVTAPRAMRLADVQDKPRLFASLSKTFQIAPVKGDLFSSFVAALLHHAVVYPQSSGAIARGLRQLPEPKAEPAEVEEGFVLIHRWARSLELGAPMTAKNEAFAAPLAVAKTEAALRAIVRYIQRTSKKKDAVATSPLEVLENLAQRCGLSVQAHGAGPHDTVEPDANPAQTLHVLARTDADDKFDVLVPTQNP